MEKNKLSLREKLEMQQKELEKQQELINLRRIQLAEIGNESDIIEKQVKESKNEIENGGFVEIIDEKIVSPINDISVEELQDMEVDQEVLRIINEIKSNISITYIGEDDMIDDVLVALLCGGHVLIEGVPGIGKTTLATALAKSLNAIFKRIQFTPDTTPSDIVGFNMYNPKTGEFQFSEGAVFTNILIADEINRTNPKVQSGLLEAMAEHQVSVDGVIYELPKLFLVVATQNPIEQFGTYELPEAQLDRFFMKFVVDYLPEDLEFKLLQQDVKMKKAGKKKYNITVSEQDIIDLQEKVKNVNIDDKNYKYIMEIILATRKHKLVKTGISTRSAVQLIEGSKARALISGRNYILPDDVKRIIRPMFNHKLILTDDAKLDEVHPLSVLDEILKKVEVPK